MGARLGIAIVKTLLERMHGAIRIERKVDVGTAVYVTLPFAIAEQVPVKEAPKKPKCSLSGMSDYLSKPLDIPKLTEAIQKFRTTPTDNGGLVG